MMRVSRFIVFASLALCIGLEFAQAAKTSPEGREIARLRTRVKKLREDIQYLQGSVKSLDELQARLNRDLRVSENEFSSRFSKIMIPLLNWPQRAMTSRATSWVEKEHIDLLVERVREKIIHQPLEMIADRDSKLRQSENLKTEFSDALKSLKSKEALLDLQLEEIQQLERHAAKPKKILKEEKPLEQ